MYFLSFDEQRTEIIIPVASTGHVNAILCQRGFSTFEYFQSPMVNVDSCRIPQLNQQNRLEN